MRREMDDGLKRETDDGVRQEMEDSARPESCSTIWCRQDLSGTP